MSIRWLKNISSIARRYRHLTVFILALSLATASQGYSVLSHEAIIDSAWEVAIKPLLRARFPDATGEEMKEAHSYAYGGSVVQDLGYYPFGSKFFSNLVHYVRSGDFIEALLRDARDLDGTAFALGAMAHYAADNMGHSMGVNLAVPLLYPRLERKYGKVVTYEDNPGAHLKTEFGFDVLEVANNRYAPDAYHDHIGFQVEQPLLEQAFQETYALDLKKVFSDYDLAIGTYRWGVSSVIPKMTKVAWQIKKDEIQKGTPGITKREFLFHLSRASYNKRWREKYKRPGLGTRIIAFLIELMPKIGPFRTLAFRTPTPAAEQLFMASFNDSLRDYEQLLQAERATGSVALPNDNFDTGSVTKPGGYSLADETYAEWLDRLAANQFAGVTPEVRQAILEYYTDMSAPFSDRRNKKQWAQVVDEINQLKTYDPSKIPAAAASHAPPQLQHPQAPQP